MMHSKFQIDTEKLDAICSEKIDLMNFVEWNIPLIVQYIAKHKDIPGLRNKDQINQLIELASKVEVSNNIASSDPNLVVISREAANNSPNTTISTHNGDDDNTIVQITFLNDAPDKPSLILELLKEVHGGYQREFQ